MNVSAQVEFDRITALPISELTKDDIGFLRARSSYLRPEQKQVYANLLKGVRYLSPEDQVIFDRENAKLIASRKKAEEEKAKLTKSVKESQNPKND